MAARETGNTPLHSASVNGKLEVAKELVRLGARVDVKNASGDTPLILAAIQGHEKVITELGRLGAKLNEADNSKYTALHHVAVRGFAAAVRELLALGADPNVGEGLFTPLHAAAMSGHVEVVDILASHPSTNIDARVEGKYTPLILDII
jgi:ankyrin repeat protein